MSYGFEGYKAVERAVCGFARRRRSWRFARELGLYLTVALGALLVWSVSDWQLRLPAAVVLGGLAVAAGAVAVGLAAWAVVAIRRSESRHWEAVNIERLHGRLDNGLIGTLQLVEEARRGQDVYSSSLIDAVATETAEMLKGERLARLIDRRPAARMIASAGVLAACSLALVVLVDGFIPGRVASARGSYQAMVEKIWPVHMAVSPGDKTLLRGEDSVALAVEVRGGQHYTSVRLIAEDDEGKGVVRAALPLVAAGSGVKKAERVLDARSIAGIPKHFTYHFAAGPHVSKTHTIRLVERPRIENLSAELSFPAYTQMMPQQLAGMFSSIRALRETTVTLSLASNKGLSRATLTFGGDASTAQALDVSGRFAATQFTIKADVAAELQLECEDGYQMAEPFRFKIEALDDSPPEIQILMKKGELMLLKDEARTFSFAYQATDDFGVAQVQVLYEIEPVDPTLGREKRTGELKPLAFTRPERKATGVMKKAFEEIELRPGDRLTFHMVATDNNTKTGPSRGRSASFSFVVVLPNLAGYNQPEFDWAQRRSMLLGALKKVRRNTDFLRLPEKQVMAEKTVAAPKHKLAAHVPPEGWPAGAEQAVTDYLQLLSTHSGE